MYKRILVAIENSAADRTILAHVTDLARLTGAELLLVHVADGFAARHFDDLKLRESQEMREDRAYLERTAATLRETSGLTVTTRLAMGDPPREILKLAHEEACDLLAMTTHGHRLIGDIMWGSTIEYVRHRCKAPLLIVSAAHA